MLLAKGAEAELYLVDWFGLKAVLKWRRPKPYRDPSLDEQIRRRRTVAEVRNMYLAHRLGVPVPAVYFFDPRQAKILMEYLEGPTLASLLREGRGEEHLEAVGRYVGVMHGAGLLHGDLAPTNVIVRGRPHLVDFGLGEARPGWGRKASILMARDVNVLLRSLDLLGERAEGLKALFWRGYGREMGPRAEAVMAEVARLRAAGRYAQRAGQP